MPVSPPLEWAPAVTSADWDVRQDVSRNPPRELPQLEVRSRAEWRRWLQRNHASSSGVWLVFYKAHTGRTPVTYDAAVEEALCFGWIDSTTNKLDADRYLQRFSPRRRGSRWSVSNLERVRRLMSAGLMTPAGMELLEGAELRPALITTVSDTVGEDVKRAVAKNRQAAKQFALLPPGYLRTTMRWINTAKKPETRARRIAEFVTVTARGERIGPK